MEAERDESTLVDALTPQSVNADPEAARARDADGEIDASAEALASTGKTREAETSVDRFGDAPAEEDRSLRTAAETEADPLEVAAEFLRRSTDAPVDA